MALTQEQIDIQNANLRKKRIRLELLDDKLKILEELEGLAVGGNISADASQTIRYSGSVTIALPPRYKSKTFLTSPSKYFVSAGGKIWLDKRVRISIGIDKNSTNTVWIPMGIFYIDQPKETYSATDYSISFDCADQMVKLTGARQGQLTGLTTMIPKGEYQTVEGKQVYVQTRLVDAFRSVITELAGINNFAIYPIPEKYEYLPYDIKVSVGATVYDILSQLMNILSTWQMYFKRDDGTLIIEPIPSGVDDIVYPLNGMQLVADNQNIDFQNVKNQVIVYGKLHTLSFFVDDAEDIILSNPDNDYTLTLTYEKIEANSLSIGSTIFAFQNPSYNDYPINKLKIVSKGIDVSIKADEKDEVSQFTIEGVLVNEYGTPTPLESNSLSPDDIYCFTIASATLKSDNTIDFTQPVTFIYYSKQQVSYSLEDSNIESPYYINEYYSEQPNYWGDFSRSFYAINGEGKQLLDYQIFLGSNLPASEEISITDGTIITFKADRTNLEGSYITLKKMDGSDIPPFFGIDLKVYNDTVLEPIPANKFSNDYTVIAIKYSEANNCFIYLGRAEGVLTQVFSGGEFDNIYTDTLAENRCLLELYNHSNTNDTADIQCVPNYTIDVNCKFPLSYINQDTGVLVTDYFLSKKINYPLEVSSSPQTIQGAKIYDSGNLLGSDYYYAPPYSIVSWKCEYLKITKRDGTKIKSGDQVPPLTEIKIEFAYPAANVQLLWIKVNDIEVEENQFFSLRDLNINIVVSYLKPYPSEIYNIDYSTTDDKTIEYNTEDYEIAELDIDIGPEGEFSAFYKADLAGLGTTRNINIESAGETFTETIYANMQQFTISNISASYKDKTLNYYYEYLKQITE